MRGHEKQIRINVSGLYMIEPSVISFIHGGLVKLLDLS